MSKISLRFLSGNKHKIIEAQRILGFLDINIVPVTRKIEELQTTDTEKLVRDKVLKAYGMTGRPLFVEHTGLYLDHLNGFPGGLTQVFWDTLGPDRFSEMFGNIPNTRVIAKTIIAYTDGQKIYSFHGEISGYIAPKPQGDREFQWDCVFIPEGYNKTFSEIGEEKDKISMRRKALDLFANHLQANGVNHAATY